MVRIIDSYIIGKTLGEGASAKVKLGTNQNTGERVALKLVKLKALLGGANTSHLVQREIDAMLHLKHENVLCIKEVNYNAEYPKKNGKFVRLVLIVIEFAAGGELFEYLAATGPFDENTARNYFKQLMKGVKYCHSKNVVHRDLKPENLLFDENFVLKIADFGFSKVEENASECMFTQCGSPGYMAPEVLTQVGYDARKADAWACGVILFILVAGFPPFQKPDVSDWWFDKLHTGQGELFWKAHSRTVDVSHSLKQLILNILCTEPSLRFSVDQILASEWLKEGQILDQSDLCMQLRSRQTMMVHEQERVVLVARQQKTPEQAESENSVSNNDSAGSVPSKPNNAESGDKSRNTLMISAVAAVASAAVAACAFVFFSPFISSFVPSEEINSLSSSPSSLSSSFGASVPLSRALSPSTNLFSVLPSGYISNPKSFSVPASTSSLPSPGASGAGIAAITLFAASVTTGLAWATKNANSTRRRIRRFKKLELYSSQMVNFTVVESEKDAATLFNLLQKWVAKQHPSYSQLSAARFKLKATVRVAGQEISFRAQVFKSDKQNNSRVVEFMRLQGDGIQFRELFGQLKSEIEK